MDVITAWDLTNCFLSYCCVRIPIVCCNGLKFIPGENFNRNADILRSIERPKTNKYKKKKHIQNAHSTQRCIRKECSKYNNHLIDENLIYRLNRFLSHHRPPLACTFLQFKHRRFLINWSQQLRVNLYNCWIKITLRETCVSSTCYPFVIATDTVFKLVLYVYTFDKT